MIKDGFEALKYILNNKNDPFCTIQSLLFLHQDDVSQCLNLLRTARRKIEESIEERTDRINTIMKGFANSNESQRRAILFQLGFNSEDVDLHCNDDVDYWKKRLMGKFVCELFGHDSELVHSPQGKLFLREQQKNSRRYICM